jgi:hypothetical protein
MARFLDAWFKGGRGGKGGKDGKNGQAPIHPGTLVNDVETFDELVVRFVNEEAQSGDRFRAAVDLAYQHGFDAGQGLKG